MAGKSSPAPTAISPTTAGHMYWPRMWAAIRQCC